MIDEKINLSHRLAIAKDYIPIEKMADVRNAYNMATSFDALPNDIKKIIVDAEKRRDYELGIR